jgi:hypothetical protein
MNPEKPFFKVKGSVLEASVLGFFKIKGLATGKSGKCHHVSCGSVSPTVCPYYDGKRRYEAMLSTGKGPYGLPATQIDKDRAKKNLDYHDLDHKNKCTDDWCKVYYGARPLHCNESVQCTRLHLEAYTDKELADPKIKPESVAINVNIALNSTFETSRGIALYDLMEDKWFKDTWWTTTGFMSTKLMPHKHDDWPAPKELAQMDQVLVALKAQL